MACYLAWEEEQALRHEFDDIQPVAMTGGIPAHATIPANLIVAGDGALRALPEIGIEIPLAEFYADLDLSAPPENEAA
jgi:hypothetical protein